MNKQKEIRKLSLKEEEEVFGNDKVAIRRYRCALMHIKYRNSFEEIVKSKREKLNFVKDAVNRYKGKLDDFRDATKPDVRREMEADTSMHKKRDDNETVPNRGFFSRLKDWGGGSPMANDVKSEVSKEDMSLQNDIIPSHKSESLIANVPVSLSAEPLQGTERAGSNVSPSIPSENEQLTKPLDIDALLQKIEHFETKYDALYAKIEQLGDAQNSLRTLVAQGLTEEFGILHDKLKATLNNELHSIDLMKTNLEKIENQSNSYNTALQELNAVFSSTNRNLHEQNNTIRGLQSKFERLPSTTELRQVIEPLAKQVRTLQQDFAEYQTLNIPKRLDALDQSFDMIRGKLEVLEDIQKALQDKGVSIRQEFPPAGEDEDKIVQLGLYGTKILDLLTIAARHYAKNRSDISRAGVLKHEQELREIRNSAIEEGKRAARLDTVKEFIQQFADLDAVFDSNIPETKIFVGFLKNHGLRREEQLSQGQWITITHENRTQFEPKARFEGVGMFIVTKSCFKIDEQLICKAELRLQDDVLVQDEQHNDSACLENQSTQAENIT